ncbi:hypothetical protein V2A60_009399 [Cordyceps javanica]
MNDASEDLGHKIMGNEQSKYIDRIVKAIDTLLTIAVPADAAPAPYRGGRIRHPLLKDGEAIKQFDDLASLQEYVNYIGGMPQIPRFVADPPRPE